MPSNEPTSVPSAVPTHENEPAHRNGPTPQTAEMVGTARPHRYTVHDLTTTLNISRTTLLYYEKIGIVQPQRVEGSNYRFYSDADVFRLMSAILLKNVGVAPKELGDVLDDAPFSADHLDGYLQSIDRQIEYHQAQRICTENLVRLKRSIGEGPRLVDVEPYYILFDHAEGGYSDFPASPQLASLIENLPIGGLGSLGSGSYFDDAASRWGRTVAVRFAHLIDGLPEHAMIIGGCRCVRLVVFKENLFDTASVIGDTREILASFMEENGLRTAGATFCPYSLPSESGFYVPVCQPVEFVPEALTKPGGRPRRLRDLLKRERRNA